MPVYLHPGRVSPVITERRGGGFFLAAEDGRQAKVRPLGAHIEMEGKEYFTVGDFKAVYRQMVENPLVEITAFTPKDRKWLHYTGKAVFEDNKAVQEQVLEHFTYEILELRLLQPFPFAVET